MKEQQHKKKNKKKTEKLVRTYMYNIMLHIYRHHTADSNVECLEIEVETDL